MLRARRIYGWGATSEWVKWWGGVECCLPLLLRFCLLFFLNLNLKHLPHTPDRAININRLLSPLHCHTHMTEPSTLTAYLALFFSGLIFGVWNIIAKLTISNNASPLLFTTVRSITTLPFLFVLAGGKETINLSFTSLQINKSNRKSFLLLGCCQFGVQTCYIYGVKLTSSQIASFFQCVAPVVTVGLATLLKFEKLAKMKVCACFLAAAGVTALSVNTEEDDKDDDENNTDDKINMLGIGLLLLEAFFISLGTLLQKSVLPNHSATFVIFMQTLISTPLLLCVCLIATFCKLELESFPPWPDTTVEFRGWMLGFCYSIIFCTIVGYTARAWANKILNASVVVVSSILQPLTTCLVAWFWLDERLGWLQFVGGILIVLACLAAGKAQQKEKKLLGEGVYTNLKKDEEGEEEEEEEEEEREREREADNTKIEQS